MCRVEHHINSNKSKKQKVEALAYLFEQFILWIIGLVPCEILIFRSLLVYKKVEVFIRYVA